MKQRVKSGWSWAVVLLLCASVSHGQEEAKPPTVAEVMRQKLSHAKEVLAGIAVQDFDQIGKNAQALAELTQNDNWTVYRSPEYDGYTREFRRAADILIEAAEENNGDAATLGYVRLTLTCVRCHEHMRAGTEE